MTDLCNKTHVDKTMDLSGPLRAMNSTFVRCELHLDQNTPYPTDCVFMGCTFTGDGWHWLDKIKGARPL